MPWFKLPLPPRETLVQETAQLDRIEAQNKLIIGMLLSLLWKHDGRRAVSEETLMRLFRDELYDGRCNVNSVADQIKEEINAMDS